MLTKNVKAKSAAELSTPQVSLFRSCVTGKMRTCSSHSFVEHQNRQNVPLSAEVIQKIHDTHCL